MPPSVMTHTRRGSTFVENRRTATECPFRTLGQAFVNLKRKGCSRYNVLHHCFAASERVRDNISGN